MNTKLSGVMNLKVHVYIQRAEPYPMARCAQNEQLFIRRGKLQMKYRV